MKQVFMNIKVNSQKEVDWLVSQMPEEFESYSIQFNETDNHFFIHNSSTRKYYGTFFPTPYVNIELIMKYEEFDLEKALALIQERINIERLKE